MHFGKHAVGEALGSGERQRRLLRRLELRVHPGRVPGLLIELAELRDFEQRLDRLVHRVRECDDGLGVESYLVGRFRITRKSGEFTHGVENADPETRVGLRQSRSIFPQNGPHSNQCGVDIGRVGCGGLLNASDRPDEVTTQRGRRNPESVKAKSTKSATNRIESRTARANHQHTLARPHEFTDRVHNGLGRASTRRGADDNRISRNNVRDDSLLLGIRIQHQRIGVETTGVRVTRIHRSMAFGDNPRRIVVAAQCIKQRVVEETRCADHF